MSNIDFFILDFINDNLKNAFLNYFMRFVSFLGNSGMIWIIFAVILLFLPKYRVLGVTLLIGLLVGAVNCDFILKPLIARERPFIINQTIEIIIKNPGTYSFPSGHTTSSFIAATILMFKDKKTGIPALILASLIAFSRVYLYVHYPSDVLFGIILGVTIGFFMFKFVYPRFQDLNKT